MSNVKSFNVNGTSAPINIVNETEDGFMSSQDYIKLVDISSGVDLNTVSGNEVVYPNEIITIVDNPEFADAKTDSDGKIIESTSYEGNKRFYADVTIDGKLNSITIETMNSSINEQIVSLNSELDKLSSDTQHQFKFFDFAIDTSLGVLRICGKTYKLIDYEGDAVFDEYIDATAFVDSTETVDNPEFTTVVVDSSNKVLYGVHDDGTQTDIDLYGVTVTDPSTGEQVTLNSVIHSLKIDKNIWIF